MKENFGDRYAVKPNESFLKTWTFRNNGETEWPEDTLFIQTNGDDLNASSFIVNEIVKPGQEITVTLEMVAPKLPGKYCAFFRFVFGDNHRFGQKVWCDILVQEEEKIQPRSAAPNSNVSSASHKEEKSSLLNDSDSNEFQSSIEVKQPLL